MTTRLIALLAPRSTVIHWGSLNCDDHRVVMLPSTALEASRPAASMDDAVAVRPVIRRADAPCSCSPSAICWVHAVVAAPKIPKVRPKTIGSARAEHPAVKLRSRVVMIAVVAPRCPNVVIDPASSPRVTTFRAEDATHVPHREGTTDCGDTRVFHEEDPGERPRAGRLQLLFIGSRARVFARAESSSWARCQSGGSSRMGNGSNDG